MYRTCTHIYYIRDVNCRSPDRGSAEILMQRSNRGLLVLPLSDQSTRLSVKLKALTTTNIAWGGIEQGFPPKIDFFWSETISDK